MSKILYQNIVLIGLIILSSLLSTMARSATEKYQDFSWQSPNGWQGGIFEVPTWFAKDMRYTGHEVIRFHDGFYDAKSTGYWTYAFVLLINETEIPTTEKLLEETKRYFVGLVRTVGDNKVKNYSAAKIQVTKISDWTVSEKGTRRSQNYFLKSFDSFTTGKPVDLNVKITTWLCSDSHRAIHYTVSPHAMSHAIWKELEQEIDALKCS